MAECITQARHNLPAVELPRPLPVHCWAPRVQEGMGQIHLREEQVPAKPSSGFHWVTVFDVGTGSGLGYTGVFIL